MKTCYRVVASGLRVRARPCTNPNCTILDVLSNGAHIEVNGTIVADGYIWGSIGKDRWCALAKVSPRIEYAKKENCAEDGEKWSPLRGIDFSEFVTLKKPEQFWREARASLFIMRASQGVYADAAAYRFGWARQYRRPTGAYIVITPYQRANGTSQVYAGASIFAPMRGDILAIDIEYNTNLEVMKEYTNQAAEALLNVCRQTGAVPVLYTSAYYWGVIFGDDLPDWLGNVYLWIADYEDAYFGKPRLGKLKEVEHRLVMHQYAGTVPGRKHGYPWLSSVDMNLVDKDFLRMLADMRSTRWTTEE